MSWENVVIETKDVYGRCGKKLISKGRKILDGISGSALPGEFVSILGASGAGKTTLLNHLSGRLMAMNLKKSGEIKINGVEKSKVPGFGEFACYVQQDDVLYQTMTVRECLDFCARLKINGTE